LETYPDLETGLTVGVTGQQWILLLST
jgi:hypothetical protein